MMTVAELVKELQKHPPEKRVEVWMRSVSYSGANGVDTMEFSDEQSEAVDEVVNAGAFVLIVGGSE